MENNVVKVPLEYVRAYEAESNKQFINNLNRPEVIAEVKSLIETIPETSAFITKTGIFLEKVFEVLVDLKNNNVKVSWDPPVHFFPFPNNVILLVHDGNVYPLVYSGIKTEDAFNKLTVMFFNIIKEIFHEQEPGSKTD